MNKHHTSRSRTIHTSHLPLTIPDSVLSSDCSQQGDNAPHQEETCHRHRNNHNSGLIHHDEVPTKSINDVTHRKRRMTIPTHQRSHKKPSLVPIYINNTLLILIRLMILFITVFIIGFTFYYAIVYIYPKPKRSGWERAWFSVIDWLSGE